MALQIDLKGLTLSPKISLGDFIYDSDGELYRITSSIDGEYMLYNVSNNKCYLKTYCTIEELINHCFDSVEIVKIIKECDMELSYIGIV